MGEQGRAMSARGRVPAAERFAIVLAAVVLLGVAFLFVLLTIDLVAAAYSSSYSVWQHLGLPSASGPRIAWLFAGTLVGILLVIAGLRLRDPVLRIAVPDGVVVLRAGAVEQSLERSMAADPDVLRTEARVRSRRGALRTEVLIATRPLADERRIQTQATTRLYGTLCEATGMECPPLKLTVHRVPVTRLTRYL